MPYKKSLRESTGAHLDRFHLRSTFARRMCELPRGSEIWERRSISAWQWMLLLGKCKGDR